MNIEEFRDALIRVADEYEELVTENLALKAVMKSALPQRGEPPLQQQVDQLIHDMSNGPVHRRYDGLRQQIRKAAEDRQLLELLMQSPPKGEPN